MIMVYTLPMEGKATDVTFVFTEHEQSDQAARLLGYHCTDMIRDWVSTEERGRDDSEGGNEEEGENGESNTLLER